MAQEKLPIQLEFSTKKLGIITVKGAFKEIFGQIEFSVKRPSDSYFDIKIDASAIETGNKKRDEHLISKDFFDTSIYNQIAFESKEVKKSNDVFIMKGNLKIKERIKALTVTLNVDDVWIYGTLNVQRKDFDLGTKIPSFIVSNKVDISFKLSTIHLINNLS